MMLHIPEVLSKIQVQRIRAELDTADAWQNGQLSAGAQAQKIKQNLQFDLQHPSCATLSQDILSALKQQTLIQSFALPLHILQPMFNCYQNTAAYGNHVDNAVQYCAQVRRPIRTDVSMTLFLSEPEEYQGGELIIEDSYGSHAVKLNAGDAIVYPATSLHRVEPVTAGQRIAAFTWCQSMVKDDWQRSMLFNLDMTILQLRQQLGDTAEVLALTAHYHNLIRQWSQL